MNRVIIEETYFFSNTVPELTLKEREDEKYPFNFGKRAARLLLQALKQEPDFLEKFLRQGTGDLTTPARRVAQ